MLNQAACTAVIGVAESIGRLLRVAVRLQFISGCCLVHLAVLASLHGLARCVKTYTVARMSTPRLGAGQCGAHACADESAYVASAQAQMAGPYMRQGKKTAADCVRSCDKCWREWAQMMCRIPCRDRGTAALHTLYHT